MGGGLLKIAAQWDLLYVFKALIDSGRDILYICAWIHKDYDADYAEVGRTCNIFRNYVDVADSWDSVIKIINYYAKHQVTEMMGVVMEWN